MSNIAIIGGSGAIGYALTQALSSLHPKASIHVFSRSTPDQLPQNAEHHFINYQDETSIAEAAILATKNLPLDLIITATGMLHDDDLKPEKSLRDVSAKHFLKLFKANTITPALVAKHFAPLLNASQPSTFAALSARVGSISDNRLGGWYAYRASKAALNMIIKNTAIEVARKNKNAIIVSLHPGTVDSSLSKPFQANIPAEKLFSPNYSASKLIAVINQLQPIHSGKCFAWDGQEVMP